MSNLYVSCTVNEHRDLQFPMETLWAIEREAHVMSSGTNEDEDGGNPCLITDHYICGQEEMC